MKTSIYAAFILCFWVTACAAQSKEIFSPLEQWKAAIIRGDVKALKGFYSQQPIARISVITKGSSEISPDSDVSFWIGLKARRMELKIAQSEEPQAGVREINFEATVRTAPPGRTFYVVESQVWQMQGESWKLVAVQRTEERKLEQPVSLDVKLYPAGVNAREEIRLALVRAAKTHKHVLVIFGADWCYDCHVLDKAFRRPDIAPILNTNFEIVHVDIGDGDKNADLMNEYQVPMDRKVPAIAVLDSAGKLLYSQRHGEFKDARILSPEELLAFLNQWKPRSPT
jgi:thioredoxin 1